jgi:hypothetical protein
MYFFITLLKTRIFLYSSFISIDVVLQTDCTQFEAFEKELKFQNDESRICLFFISSISNKLFFVAKNLLTHMFYLCGQNSFRVSWVDFSKKYSFESNRLMRETDWHSSFAAYQACLTVWQNWRISVSQKATKSQKIWHQSKRKRQTKDCQTLLYGRLSDSISILIQFCFCFSFTQSWDLTLILKSDTTSSDFVLW